jgi:phosphoribosylformylglycinamidine cyclo-ligase
MEVMRSRIAVHGFAHISGDGLLNLLRLDAEVGYRFTALPPVSPIFDVIQREGGVSDEEMWRVFNMGVGFCIVVAATDVDSALTAIHRVGGEAIVAGEVVAGPKRIELPTVGLIGRDGTFEVSE